MVKRKSKTEKPIERFKPDVKNGLTFEQRAKKILKIIFEHISFKFMHVF